jgi:hypothetical protein
MELKEFFYWSLYTVITGLAISMIYINGMDIGEEKQSSRITSIIFLIAIVSIYLANKGIDFLKILKYTGIFFLGIFGLYLAIQFLGSFSGYDLISYHGVAILATLVFIYYIAKFFNRAVNDV